MVGAFLGLGYPVGAATPFRGVRALGRSGELTVTGGRLVVTRRLTARRRGAGPRPAPVRTTPVAAALVEAVAPLGERGFRSSCP